MLNHSIEKAEGRQRNCYSVGKELAMKHSFRTRSERFYLSEPDPRVIKLLLELLTPRESSIKGDRVSRICRREKAHSMWIIRPAGLIRK